MRRAGKLRPRVSERGRGSAPQGPARGRAGRLLSLDVPALIARARALSPHGPLALGLSGGGDSTALLHLLAALSERDSRPLHALIVDHGLRPESGAEADRAAAAARALGARARILRWTAPVRSQAAARTARHRLLAQACRETGAQVLFLAHTREDLIETIAMRLARSGGGRTLAAMSQLDPSPVWPEGRGLRIARPLLETPRAQLRTFLAARGADWIEDPSNADPRYERIRLRQAGLSDQAEFAGRLLRLGAAAAGLERHVRAEAARLLAGAARPLSWGGLALDAGAFALAPAPVARRAMEFALLAVSGEPDLPGPGRVQAMLAALKDGRTQTAAGALLNEAGLIGRDPGAAAGRADGEPGAPPLTLRPGETGIFDRRLEVEARVMITVRAAGRQIPAGLETVPAVFRPGLAVIEAGGESLAAHRREAVRYGTMRPLTGARLLHLSFPFGRTAWFDRR